ncbi:WD repeat-containing protein [Coprinopsis sp. MPI-PUGE-AT-0042]|nr:WD repeat-containing protein [Coprinopsis sp. MPI-PUGE-AT-0042]
MRLSPSLHDSILTPALDSKSELGSSTNAHDGIATKNGHTNGFSRTSLTNGSAGEASSSKQGRAVSKINLPGAKLYGDSSIQREEFVRLVVQTLRDVGYIESAATLEAESGYELEAPLVSQFRQDVLDGMWSKAEGALQHLNIEDEENKYDAEFLIKEQKYLELLEAKKTTEALHVLRNELAPLNVDSDHLHTLSSSDATSFSLLSDHQCGKTGFPNVTTTVLEVHSNEVWCLEWSHDGRFLASGGRDTAVLIWKMGSPVDQSTSQEWKAHLVLPDHPYEVGAIAWSPDDSVLVTGAEHLIKMWNMRTGVCIRTMDTHEETISSISWLPDGSGFYSAGLDRKIILWDSEGNLKEDWPPAPIRIHGHCLSRDGSRLVAIGQDEEVDRARDGAAPAQTPGGTPGKSPKDIHHRLAVFDVEKRSMVWSVRYEGEFTSISLSPDSQYALVSHDSEVIYLYDIQNGRLENKYIGQRQGKDIIKSCFGGVNGSFVLSGSEDGNVYVWHRDSSTLLEVLSGHGEGSVNAVAWHPHERLFASCSDDHTIRIWEAPPLDRLEEFGPPQHLDTTVANGKGKGKVRQVWENGGASG